MSEIMRTVAVGITGASGAVYAARTVATLLEHGCQVELVASVITLAFASFTTAVS